MDKGQELNHITPEEEVTDLEPEAPAEAPAATPEAPTDAAAPAADPWVASYEAASK